MKMSFKLALLCLGLNLTYANAQVGMPTNNPNKDAVLDLNRTDGTSAKGLLLPKVALTDVMSASPMTAHVEGMHVWNTATDGTGVNSVSPGEYFNNGSKWVRISSTTDSWIQDGNNNGAIKAIGTNDAFDLPIETNGAEKMRITAGGQVLVNTATSMTGGTNAKLQINNGTTAGAVQIKDGTEGAGKVLTSDGNGVGSWKAAASQYTILGTIPNILTTPITSVSSTFYTGCYIDLPVGQWNIFATVSFSAGGSNVTKPSTANSGFASFFFSTSNTVTSMPNYASNIKSIIISPTYHGNNNNIGNYGTGSIPVTITGGLTRIYLWGFFAPEIWSFNLPATPNIALASATSYNNYMGSYGPYTQLYAVPITY